MRIGVIGSGIAGLVASRRLSESGHRVTLFERQSTIGMDSHSLDVVDTEGVSVARADVPSRMFNATEWPCLFELYRKIDVQSVEVSSSQTFSVFGGKTYLKMSQAHRPASLAATLVDRKSRKIISDARRLQSQGRIDIRNGLANSETILAYLHDADYSDEFIYEFLYPTLSSTVCTCSYESLDRYPASTILSILNNLTIDNALLRTRDGTDDVVKRILSDAIDLRLNSEVASVRVCGESTQVIMANGECPSFDHLVVATQANSAIRLIPNMNEAEHSVLSSFHYESIPILVHTDRNFMPRRQKDWATFNMLIAPDQKAAMCSVWLNQFHADWSIDFPVFQTINAFAKPDVEQTVGESVLQRPVVDKNSIAAWDSISKMNADPERRIWFCGSYAGRGTPLLESGVVSANAVVEAIQHRT